MKPISWEDLTAQNQIILTNLHNLSLELRDITRNIARHDYEDDEEEIQLLREYLRISTNLNDIAEILKR